jgi:hypothetical protein
MIGQNPITTATIAEQNLQDGWHTIEFIRGLILVGFIDFAT